MPSDDLVEGQEYVISFDVEKNGDEHPQLDPGDLVTLVNGNSDSDGEVYVTATAVADGASVGAWVKKEYLMTKEEAARWVQENSDIAYLADDAQENGHNPDSPEVIREFSYIPHPEYPNLPTFETLPLGYALGVVSYIRDLGAKPVDPQVAFIQQYLKGRGFPTG